jgi:hypothetical protein
MQSKENAWTYVALKQAKEMALQLLHLVAGYWFWQKKKNNGHACFGLFSLLLPVFFSSLFLLLFSAFFFLFSLFTVANRNSCSPRFICTSLAFFSALFSLFFSSFYALSFCFSFLESWR